MTDYIFERHQERIRKEGTDMKLKPCPFCGGTSLTVDSKAKEVGSNGLDIPVDNVTFSVRCNKCHARGATAGGRVLRYTLDLELPKWSKTRAELYEQAISAWNRRAE